MKTHNAPYLPGVDHLRGAAALLITCFHGFQYFRAIHHPAIENSKIETANPFFILMLEGHTAVSLFMTLSGFIFTYIALGKSLSYFGFLRNRVLRIFPLFIALLAIGFYSLPASAQSFQGLLATLLMFSNTSMALDAAPFTTMFWTTAIEFQFYLLFPWLLIFLEREGSKSLIRIMLFFAMMKGLVYLAHGNALHMAYWTIIGRIDQFCLGMIAAKLSRTHSVSLKKYSHPILLLSIAGILLFWGIVHQFKGLTSGPWRIWLHTLEASLWAGVIVSYLDIAEKLPRLASKILCYLGTISYSVYLTHYIVIDIAFKNKWIIPLTSHPHINATLNTLLFAYPIILLVSSISYFAIEQPFLNLRKTYTAEH